MNTTVMSNDNGESDVTHRESRTTDRLVSVYSPMQSWRSPMPLSLLVNSIEDGARVQSLVRRSLGTNPRVRITLAGSSIPDRVVASDPIPQGSH